MDSIRRVPKTPPHLPKEKPSSSVQKNLPARTKTSVTPTKKQTRFFLGGASILLFLFIFTFFFLFGKSLFIGHHIQFQNTARPSLLSDLKRLAVSFVDGEDFLLRGEKDGRINILLLGRAGERYPGKNLTDTVMIMSIDTHTKKVALLSLPRDLYVPIQNTNLSTKVNALYQYDLREGGELHIVRSSIEHIIGQPLHYFFMIDFDGFEKTIDTLGGIAIEAQRDFYDTRYPGKNYSYETFSLKKGWHILDGATTLKYVRERHDDPEGDFGRAKRQQQVLQAVKDKAFSLRTFLNVFTVNDLLNTLGENVTTDMTLEDIEEFLRLAKTIDTENITSFVVDAWKKESLLRVSHVPVGTINAFILVPRTGNWKEIREVNENIFHLDTRNMNQKNIEEEHATITLLYAEEDSLAAKKIRDFMIETLSFAKENITLLGILENQPEQSMITDRSVPQKSFSIDALLKKFSLEQTLSLHSSLPDRDTSDIIMVIGKNLGQSLNFEETFGLREEKEEIFLEEPFSSQYNIR
ncbi:MAG: LCP family protein [Candidatus Moranbacteria bacterium]|nr:LCP family protein [Candidatus Moranbacteria bacterium]